jgi:hypothetical protein
MGVRPFVCSSVPALVRRFDDEHPEPRTAELTNYD